jgi:hypothetical protein
MPIRESINRCRNAVLTNVKMKIKFNPSARVRHIYRGKPANSYFGRGKSDNELVINIGNIEINKMYDRLNKDYNNRVYKEDELKNILQGRDPDYSVFSLCGDKNDDTESSEAVEICNGE